jgi:hypothetical protein
MATQYSNKPIVTDGLVYALDFGNQKSYVSGSNSARSLLFNPLTASVSGSPTFTTTGLLNLSSTSNVLTNKTFSELTINNSYTVSTLVQVKSGGTFWNQDTSPSSEASSLGTTSTGVGHLVTDSAYLQGTNFRRGFNADLSQLTHITYRNYSGSFDVFINGIPVNTTGDVFLLRGGGLNLNGRSNGDSFWSGSIGNFYIYNRALTSDEIYSNYLLTAQRFGLRTSPKPYTVDENAYLFLSQSGITDPIITSSIDTFVKGLKANNLWGKMAVIYPFVGTGSVGVNLTGSHRINLKEPGINALTYSGSWNGSTSGSAPSGSGTYIDTGVSPQSTFPYYVANNYHMSILSYDTPVSSSILAGTGMTKELAVSTLAGDYGTPAAAYSVRKVRTAYSGALMDVRRSIDNVTSSFGYVSNGDLDTGSLSTFVNAVGEYSPGSYSGLAAAYSLRKVSASYSGFAIDVRRDSDNTTGSIGFDASGNLDTGSLLTFLSSSTVLPGAYSNLSAAYSLRKVVPAYTGFAIMIQSASVSQSIGFTSTGDLDTGSIATFAGSGDAFVQIWYDQSGNNNHATQSSAANQPKIYSGSLGTVTTEKGKPALVFDGTDELLTLNRPLNGTTPFTILGVSRKTDLVAGGGNAFTGGGSDSQTALYAHHYYFAPQAPTPTFLSAWGSANGVSFSSQSLDTGSAYLSFSTYTPGLHQYWINGVAGTTSSKSDSNLSGGSWGIGSLGNLVVSIPTKLIGTIQELLFYTADQSSNRKSIENNINTYYNVYPRPSGYVAQWYDQSGNARHATQTTASSQPLIVSSGSLILENTKPALRFDGSSDYLDFSRFTYTSSSIFFTANIKSPRGRVLSGGQDYLFLGGGFASYTAFNNDPGIGTILSYENTQSLFSLVRNTTGFIFNINNVLDVNATQSLTTSGWERIMAESATNQTTSGSLQELLLYNTDKTADRTFIENNINTYYNVYTSSNAGYVARWYDQSGNNRHATQSVGANQPLIVLSGSTITVNSKPSTYFNNSNTVGMNFSSISTQNYTVLWVSKKDTTAATASIILAGAPGGGTYMGDNVDNAGNPSSYTNQPAIDLARGNTSPSGGEVFQHLAYLNRRNSNQAVGQYNSSSNAYANFASSDAFITSIANYGSNYNYVGNIQEIIIHASDQSSNREAMSYGINNYYNIYSQPTNTSWTTSSFTIYATTSSISASINNDLQSGIASSGPLGFITVSRTGSNSLTLARNGVTSSFTVPASGALSTNLYLGAINNNGLALGSSPYNISFASVGTGLTNSETRTLYNLVGVLNLNLRKIASDADAYNFLTVANVSGIAEQIAINTLVVELKSYGIWNKMKAIYPMVGQPGISSSFEVNLKDPTKFRGTFYGGWTFSSTGAAPNGSTGYMDTGFLPSVSFTNNNTHISVYSRTDGDKDSACLIGTSKNANAIPLLTIYSRVPGIGYVFDSYSYSGNRISTSSTLSSAAFFINSRTSSTVFKSFRNGTQLGATNTTTNSNDITTCDKPIFIGALNLNGSAAQFSNYENAFASIGDGLTDTEAANLYTAVQRFQTTLGRQV